MTLLDKQLIATEAESLIDRSVEVLRNLVSLERLDYPTNYLRGIADHIEYHLDRLRRHVQRGHRRRSAYHLARLQCHLAHFEQHYDQVA